MHIREYRESDLDALRAIHAAQGFDYALPDLRNPLFITKLVLAHDTPPVGAQHAAPLPLPTHEGPTGAAGDVASDGLHQIGIRAGKCDVEGNAGAPPIVGAAFLRLTAEAYLLLDPHTGTPRQRWQWLLALHEAARHDAWQRGLEDVHAWLPPPIAQKFGRRLTQLGWIRDDAWTPYCKRL